MSVGSQPASSNPTLDSDGLPRPLLFFQTSFKIWCMEPDLYTMGLIGIARLRLALQWDVDWDHARRQLKRRGVGLGRIRFSE